MSVSREMIASAMAEGDHLLCGDKGTALLRAGKAEESAKWYSKAIQASPANASLYWARSLAWESAGRGELAVADAGIGVCMRPRLTAGYVRLAGAFAARGQHAAAVRACYLVDPEIWKDQVFHIFGDRLRAGAASKSIKLQMNVTFDPEIQRVLKAPLQSGMRCGDSSTNSYLGKRMMISRETGKLPPIDWKPLERREKWTWVWLSFRGFLLRTAVTIAAALRLGEAPYTLQLCIGGVDFTRKPWPPGAISPALLH